MSGPYAAALEDLRRWRDHVNFLIASLEKLEAGAPTAPAASKAASDVRVSTTVRKESKAPASRGAKREANANTGIDAQSTMILNALRKTVRPVSIGELQRETKLSAYILSNRLSRLGAKRQVVITGETAAKRVSLPGSPAKEEP